MKKIIFATDTWHPEVNGVVRCIQDTKNFLEKNGFQVTIIHPNLFRNVPFIFYNEAKIALFVSRKIEKMLEQENPEYIHIFTEGPIGFATRDICLKKKLKFTTSYHTHYPFYIRHYTKINLQFPADVVYRYLRWFHGKASRTMVITEKFMNELAGKRFKNLVFWPLGVDTNFFKKNEDSDIRKKYNLQPPVFVYFGRLAKEKNVEEFFQCNLPGTKLVVGGGPYGNYLRKKYGKQTLFVGYKKGQELIDFLSVCDVFVFPSCTDTFPLAIIEALSCGIPVAAHDVMELKDVITPDVGFLDENLERAALACLKLSSQKCREKALQFSLEASGKRFIENLVKA